MDFRKLKGKKRKEILRIFLGKITVGKGKKKKVSTHLKIFVVRSLEFPPSQISESLRDLYYQEDVPKHFKRFMNKFRIEINQLNNEDHHLIIENLRSKKKIHYVIFPEEKYWTLLTLARSDDVDKSLLKILKSIPLLEPIVITTHHLESITSFFQSSL